MRKTPTKQLTEDKSYFVTVSSHELAFEIMQGLMGLRAPPGSIAKQVLESLSEKEPEMVDGFYRAARNVATLIARQINESPEAESRVRH